VRGDEYLRFERGEILEEYGTPRGQRRQGLRRARSLPHRLLHTPTVGSTNKQLVEELTHLTHAQPFAS